MAAQLAAARCAAVSRRALLHLGLLALAGGSLPGVARAAIAAPPAQVDGALYRRPRTLWVTRPQAQESVRAVYWADGQPQPEGLGALAHIYRDVHANQVHALDLALLDLNFALQAAIQAYYGPRPLVLFSGYRTAATNRRVGGVEPSIHATGQADDYIYEGPSLADNFRLGRYFQVGGLGLYPERGSLHKDVGPLRTWITRGR